MYHAFVSFLICFPDISLTFLNYLVYSAKKEMLYYQEENEGVNKHKYDRAIVNRQK